MMHQHSEEYPGHTNMHRHRVSPSLLRGILVVSVCLLVTFVAVGCTSTGTFPQTSGTQVDLSRNNFRVVKANAIGTSSGFSLFGFIPFGSPTYSQAMSDLYRTAGVTEGKAQTLTNVTQEKSQLYLILFSIPKLTIRADVIEFTD